MARLTLEIPDSLQQTLTEEAQAHGLSLEYWVLQLVQERLDLLTQKENVIQLIELWEEAHAQGWNLENWVIQFLGDRLVPISKEERAIQLLQSWIDEGDEQEQQETGHFLLQALDEDRLSDRPLFPQALQGESW